MLNLGTVRPGTTIYVYFDSFDGGTGASITMTGLAVGDIAIYKNGGTTQRASTTGFTLLDTDGIDFDSVTGIHGFSVDLSSDATADFYEAGARYQIVVNAITIDAQTVAFAAARFDIGYPDAVLNTAIATLASQTSFTLDAGPADDDALNDMWVIVHDKASAIQVAKGIISDYTGSSKTVTLVADPGIFTMAAGDNISIMGPAPLQPTTIGARLDVTATGAAGIDWGNVENKTTANDLTQTDIQLCDTVTTNTDVRGTDSAATAANLATAQADLDIITDSDGVILGAAGVDLIWDEPLTGGTHNVATSSGRRLRQLEASFVVTAGTAQAGTATTITLAAGESATDDIFRGDRVIIVEGTGVGEHGLITAYNGTTKVATMSETWVITPDATSLYELVPASVDVETWQHGVVNALVSGRVDADVGAKTGNVALSTQEKADVNAEADTAISDAALATAANLATAQLDLDTLTGSDGATLATAQGNYAPAVAGDAMALTSGERDSVAAALLDLANGVETSWTVRQTLRVIAAAVAGKLSGAATATNTIRDITDAKDRITATVDSDGNRSAVTLDGT